MIVVFRAMLPPASQLFSTMQTSVIPCREAREYAVESPCPPPPTITTSYEAFGSAARQYRTSPIANERFRDGRSRVNRSSLARFARARGDRPEAQPLMVVTEICVLDEFPAASNALATMVNVPVLPFGGVHWHVHAGCVSEHFTEPLISNTRRLTPTSSLTAAVRATLTPRGSDAPSAGERIWTAGAVVSAGGSSAGGSSAGGSSAGGDSTVTCADPDLLAKWS